MFPGARLRDNSPSKTVAYLSLYRKYRSQTFGDLIGQEHVIRTLQNGISTGRIAHAYLFTGPRGTGKTSTARLLAKALCCEQGPTPTPDNTCEICRAITLGNCVDVLEMDAASEAGVDEIREKIVEVVEYQPMMARYKVFIIDEVHDLSRQAFDALLKTIEEPPPHVIFILATTEYNKVPATIRSRCQKHEFHRASMADLVGRLKYVADGEGVEIEPAALTAIARMADGGYRDALTLLEQAIITSEEGKITLKQIYDQLGLIADEIVDGLLLAMRSQDVPKILNLLAEVSRLGRDPRSIIESLLYRLSDLTRAAYDVDSVSSADAAQEAVLHETAAQLGRERLLALRSALSEAHRVIRDISLPRVWLESELVRIATQGNPQVVKAAPAANVAPTTSRPVPQPKPKAEPAPPVKLVMAEGGAADEPKPKLAARAVVEAPPSTGDAKLDEAIAIWRQVVAALPESTTIFRKLADAEAGAVLDKQIEVRFMRKIDLDWILEKPARQTYLQTFVDQVAGPGWTTTFVVSNAPKAAQDVSAVELPAEGARLEQLAKDILAPDRNKVEINDDETS